MIAPMGETYMDHEDVVTFARLAYPPGDPMFNVRAALHYYFMKQWAKAAEAFEKVTDPSFSPIKERVKDELAKLPPPAPPDPQNPPPNPDPPKPEPKKPPAKAKAPKYPFRGKIKEEANGYITVTYDFTEEAQLDDFAGSSFFGQNNVKATWRKDKTLRLEGGGAYLWKPTLDDDVTIEVTFTSDGEGFGILVHNEGDNRAGYLSDIDFDTAFGGGYAKNFLNDNCLIYRLPLDFRNWNSLKPLVTKGGAPVKKAVKSTAWARRKGDVIEAGLGSVTASVKNGEFSMGQTGLLIGDSNLTIHTIKITAKINAKWLKEQQQ
jgi:hypothetical protein